MIRVKVAEREQFEVTDTGPCLVKTCERAAARVLQDAADPVDPNQIPGRGAPIPSY